MLVRHWNRLHRDVADAWSLEIFSIRLWVLAGL